MNRSIILIALLLLPIAQTNGGLSLEHDIPFHQAYIGGQSHLRLTIRNNMDKPALNVCLNVSWYIRQQYNENILMSMWSNLIGNISTYENVYLRFTWEFNYYIILLTAYADNADAVALELHVALYKSPKVITETYLKTATTTETITVPEIDRFSLALVLVLSVALGLSLHGYRKLSKSLKELKEGRK